MANFLLKSREIDGFEEFSLIHKASNSCFSCIPVLDGMMSGLRLSYASGEISLIKELENKEQLAKARKYCSGYILFPYPNRLNEGKYTYAGQEFHFPLNEKERSNSLHGLLNKEFTVEEVDLKNGSLSLLYEHSSADVSYPFASTLRIIYTLRANQLDVSIEIQNLHRAKIPVGIGVHPYFNFDTSVDELLLEIPSKEYVQLNEDLIPIDTFSKDEQFLRMRKINDTELDTCYVLEEEGDCHIYVPHLDVHFYMKQDKASLAYLQVYIPSDRQSIALEPMSCIPDAFNNGIGLVHLEEGSTFESSFSVLIQGSKEN